MASTPYEAAIAAYREGVEALLSAAPTLAPADHEALAHAPLVHSQEIERTAAAGLAAGDADVRELAAVQLAAGAALDLAAATDVLSGTEVAEEQGIAPAERSMFAQTYDEVARPLEALPALGMRAFLREEPIAEPAGGAPATLEALGVAATQAIGQIDQDAIAITKDCVEGLLGLAPGALLGALSSGADKLLGPLYARAHRHVRIAIKFVTKAVSKLMRVLGPFEVTARAWLLKQLGAFTESALAAFVVGRALGIDEIRANVMGRIDSAEQSGTPADQDRLETAYGELGTLPGRFDKHRKVIDRITWLIGKVSGALMALASWAGAAIAGVYVLILCYGIWVAGDYLDWLRMRMEGRLDLVVGVRSIVNQALVTDATPIVPA